MSFPFNQDKRNGKKGGGSQDDLFDSTPSYREEVEAFIAMWNKHIWLPKIVGTDRQVKMIRLALQRPFFARNWRDCFSMLAKSSFVWSKMKPPLDIDWYLRPDNFDKIMEGKYLDDKHKQPSTENTRTKREGYEEEIL